MAPMTSNRVRRAAACAPPALVALGAAREAAVEPAEEAGLTWWWPALTGLSSVAHSAGVSDSAKKARERDRHAHDGGELAVDVADRAAEEGQRHEHRDQHHGDADDGARDLAHRLCGGLARRQALLAHDALDVLDHHDRVVDHDADHQHHAEHGQHVDREAQRQQRAKVPSSATGTTMVGMMV